MKFIEAITTWQGEGPSTGRFMFLLRFKKCNKKCQWCDTIVKMRVLREMEMSIAEIQSIVDERKCGIMITGGEPTLNLYLDDTVKIINEVNASIFNVETNGYNLLELISKVNPDKNVQYIYSPKIFSEEDYENEIKITNKILPIKNVFIKIVYDDTSFVNRYLKLISGVGLDDQYKKLIEGLNERVYVMPEGKDREELMKNSPKVFDIAESYNFNFSSRLHLMHDFV